MAIIYVYSGAGGSNNGSSWTDAFTSLNSLVGTAGSPAAPAAGDFVYVADDHAETALALTSGSTLRFANGTDANPVKMYSINRTSGLYSPGASCASANAVNVQLWGRGLVVEGVNFTGGSGSTGNSGITVVPNVNTTTAENQSFKDCTLWLNNSNTSARTQTTSGTASSAKLRFENVQLRFGAAAQRLLLANADFYWSGGGVHSSSTALTTCFVAAQATGRVSQRQVFSSLDLSALGTSCPLVLVGTSSSGLFIFRNCKLPASWSGTLVSGTRQLGNRVEMYNCDSGDTNYSLWIDAFQGEITSETTLVLTGGASDGTTPISWKMVSNANAGFPLNALESGEIMVWNDTTGSSKTATIDILRDSATALTDAEIWVEAEYLGTSGFPKGSLITDRVADPIATPSNQASSSATWTTTGMSNPNTQKLTVTFTPQEKGFVLLRVMLARASTTVYIDPKVTIS